MRTRFISDLERNKVVTNEMIDLVKKLTEQFEVGQYDLANGAFAVAENIVARSADKMNYQTHKKYIRLYVVLSGFEMLLSSQAKQTSFVEAAPYDDKGDALYLKGEAPYEPLLIQSGEFITIYPGEVYKIGVSVPNAVSCSVKRLTVFIPKE